MSTITPTKVTIGDTSYYPLTTPPDPSPTRIVVLQRGNIIVGTWHENGDEITIDNAAVIRVWGTTHGLGEIARGGPTPKTVLDRCPPIRFHRYTVVMSIDCDGPAWASL
jgi:hypothetical protein